MSFENISARECKKIIDEQIDHIVILDVRTQTEFCGGVIEHAKNIPLDELESRAGELPKDKKIIVYCVSGNRSMMACAILGRLGFTDCINIAGGLIAWNQEGFDIV